MRYSLGLTLGVIVSLIFVSLALSQEVQKESETLWLWGEVVSIDNQNNNLSVKYLDFETDQEKEMSINVDEKTTYENIKSLDELKPKDNVSIDYIPGLEGKNLAKNIVVENSEETLPEKTEIPPGVTQ